MLHFPSFMPILYILIRLLLATGYALVFRSATVISIPHWAATLLLTVQDLTLM